MRKSVFIKHIQSLEDSDLRSELEVLFTRFPDVKSYYAMELGSEKDREAIFAKAKKDILSKYATKSYRRPKRPRISKIKAILKKVDKISIFKEEMIDLHLFNCEAAIAFILEYGYHSDPLYNTIESSFRTACQMIIVAVADESMRERAEDVIDRAYDAYEYLGERLRTVFGEEIGEDYSPL
jgi:hypothetical protein